MSLSRKTPLRRVSTKRRKLLEIYRKDRSTFLGEHKCCQVCFANEATDIHHKLSLGRGGKLNDTTIFLAVCRVCHDWIHRHPKEAEQQGYLLKWKNET